MSELSLDLRRRIVDAYLSGLSGSYATTSTMFGVGEATVSRLLRRFRETGDVLKKPRGGNNPRRVDLDWLRRHAEAEPDARLVDRVDAWERHSGIRVHKSTMGFAMRDIGWTHKKRRR
jgi:transposase